MQIAKNAPVLSAALAALFAVMPLAAKAETAVLSKPASGATMFFADRYATAYYTLDEDAFKVTVTIAPGLDGKGNPMQFVTSLSDGEKSEYTVGGYGENAIKVKLQLQRAGDKIVANVVSETPQS